MPLRRLRIKATNAAVVLIDHTPKSEKGGAMGSVQKDGRVRTAHVVSRLETVGVGDKDMLRWEFHKFNATAPQPSFAILREQTETTACLTACDLPGETRGYKAYRALETALKLIYAAGDEGITRVALIAQVAKDAGVSERTVENVVNDDVREHPNVREVQLQGRGNPKGYRWQDLPDGDGGDGGESNNEKGTGNKTSALDLRGKPVELEAAPDDNMYGIGLPFYCPKCCDEVMKASKEGVKRRRRTTTWAGEMRSVTWRVGTDDYVFEPAPWCKKHRRFHIPSGEHGPRFFTQFPPLHERDAALQQAILHYTRV